MGKNDVAKIEMASVTQNTAIRRDTAAALMARGSIFFGGGKNIKTMKMLIFL